MQGGEQTAQLIQARQSAHNVDFIQQTADFSPDVYPFRARQVSGRRVIRFGALGSNFAEAKNIVAFGCYG